MKQKLIALPLLLACSAHAASLLTLSNPVADAAIDTGDSDRSAWDATTAYPTAADGSFPTDYKTITFAHDSENIYLRQEMHTTPDGSIGVDQVVFFDTDQNTDTGYRGPNGDYSIAAEYMLQGAGLFKYTGTTQNDWTWDWVTSVSFNQDISNDHAFSIPQELLGSPTAFDFIANTDLWGGASNYPTAASGGDNGDFYTYTIPEPTHLLLGGIGFISILLRRRSNC